MKRSTLVTLMLVIAAVMLAIGLFIAGSIWRGRASPTAVSFGQDAAISPPENSTNFVCCASSKGKPSVQPLKENRDQWRRIKKITSDLRIRQAFLSKDHGVCRTLAKPTTVGTIVGTLLKHGSLSSTKFKQRL